MKVTNTFSSYSLLSNCKKIGEKAVNNLGRFTVSAISNLVSKRIANLTIPLFLLGLYCLPKADGLIATYAICVAGCTTSTMGWGLVICIAACGPFLGPWCP
ncbi:MAG: hypothetical protein WCP39_05365 [Chlamydiota bacterium]